MTDRPRAAFAALMLACILALPSLAHGQAQAPAAAGNPMQLPPMRARPPASRVPNAAPARPATPPLVRRPAIQPVLSPATPLDLSRVPGNGETATQISMATANGGTTRFPVGPGLRGPSVLRVQVLLNRAYFAPGMLDGGWGQNTGIAVYWFQAREGLAPTGVVDSATYARLVKVAGDPEHIVVPHTLTAAEVRGPFAPLPSNIYEQAQLNCVCYESLSEKLSELFASRVELLQRLNPGVRLDSLKAGAVINVPNVRDPAAPPKGVVETLVVSGADHYLQALDASGRILYHFPTTLGSSYDPSPEGSFHVLSITENPWWHYQPAILHHGNEDAPEAQIPPGPNSAVGRVWMTLSAPHYGIHGTKSPETIGYAVSAGCVRLANWDALFLARRLTAGTPVVFRGTRTREKTNTVNRTPAAPARPTLPGVRIDSARAPVAPPADSAKRDSTRRDSSRTAAPVRTDSAPAAKPATAPVQTPPAVTPASTPAQTRPAAPAPAPAAAPKPDSAAAAKP